MRITNTHRLPAPLVAAVSRPRWYQENRWGVTDLISPPRVYQLMKRHDAEIKEDAADMIWLLFGTSVHAILERIGKETENLIVESKKEYEINGQIIVCKGDLYLPVEENLWDYKITSLWSVINRKPKPDWEQQLNMNAVIYRAHGLKVSQLNIAAILRDWSKGKAKQGGDYPQVPYRTIKVPVWGQETAEAFLKDRLNLHVGADGLLDNELPHCTPLERYARPNQWAIKKIGNKRALKLFNSEEDAEAFWADKGFTSKTHEREFRPGESVRCEDYCPAKPFCSQAKELGIE